jgi:hypothetical protein
MSAKRKKPDPAAAAASETAASAAADSDAPPPPYSDDKSSSDRFPLTVNLTAIVLLTSEHPEKLSAVKFVRVEAVKFDNQRQLEKRETIMDEHLAVETFTVTNQSRSRSMSAAHTRISDVEVEPTNEKPDEAAVGRTTVYEADVTVVYFTSESSGGDVKEHQVLVFSVMTIRFSGDDRPFYTRTDACVNAIQTKLARETPRKQFIRIANIRRRSPVSSSSGGAAAAAL